MARGGCGSPRRGKGLGDGFALLRALSPALLWVPALGRLNFTSRVQVPRLVTAPSLPGHAGLEGPADTGPFRVGAELRKSKLESGFASKISQNLFTRIYISPEQHEHPAFLWGKGELDETHSDCSINIAPSKHALSSINLFSRLPLSSAWPESGRVLSPPCPAETVQASPGLLGAELAQIRTICPYLHPLLGYNRNTHKRRFRKEISARMEVSSKQEVKGGRSGNLKQGTGLQPQVFLGRIHSGPVVLQLCCQVPPTPCRAVTTSNPAGSPGHGVQLACL